MNLHSNRATALAALVLSLSLLTACGSDDSGSDSGSESDGGGDVSLTMLPKNLGNPYFDTSTKGAEAAAEEVGATIEQVGPETGDDPAGQVPFINTVAQQGERRPHRVGQRPGGDL